MRVPAALPFCRHSLSPIRFMSCLSVPAPYLSSPGSSPPSPRAARAAPQKTTRGACASASRPPRDAPGSLAGAPSDGQESPKRPPGRPQEAPTLASRPEDGRRWLQDASRTAQGAPRRPPPREAKVWNTVMLSMFLRVPRAAPKMFQDRFKRAPRSLRDCPTRPPQTA